MPINPARPLLGATSALVVSASLVGCAGSSGNASARAAPREAEPPRVAPAPPLAMAAGRAVTLEEIAPFALEAGGGVALEEIALDRVLTREAERAGVVVTESDMVRERILLLESFDTSGAARDENEAVRLLERVRRSRGLGPTRFKALLWRTATLRKLVQPQVDVGESAIRRAHELAHGEKWRARLITVPTVPDAADAIARLPSPVSPGAFGAVAAEVSTDVSAARGGVIEPISPADASYPQAIRSALANLTPGGLSPPVALDTGFAVLLLEEVVPADGVTLEQGHAEAERRARLEQERLLMDRLAARLLAGAAVTPLDAGLRGAWDGRRARPSQ